MTTKLVAPESPNGHAAVAELTSWPLTPDEADLLLTLQDARTAIERRHQELFAAEITPLQERYERVLRRVEARLGLQPGDLAPGRYDLADGVVKLKESA